MSVDGFVAYRTIIHCPCCGSPHVSLKCYKDTVGEYAICYKNNRRFTVSPFNVLKYMHS